MKYDLDEAAREIQRRSYILKEKKQEKRAVLKYSFASAGLLAMLIAVMMSLDLFGPAMLDDSVFGSFLLSKEAGAYVLVGVICFVLAVAITLYCVRRADKNKKKAVDDDPSDDL